ncbi:MAG: AAA family ATPase [Bryobacterales bacterium]|jgi:predicted kinase|nr:AAA family ATPase [Bryobacterales bacterium]
MNTNGLPRIVLAIGLPASGKSTWFAAQGVQPLSSDGLRLLLLDDEQDQSNPRVVFSTLRWLVRRRLDLRRPVTYIDATHLTRWERSPYLAMARLYACQVEALWFDEELETCLRRNAARARVVPEAAIRRMQARLQTPTLEEGFSVIRIVRQGRIVGVLPEALDAQPQQQGDQQR